MATTPTNLPVPSESARDLKFNAGKIDEFVTSLTLKYIDRFGLEHYTIEGLRQLAQQAIAEFGWIPVDSFQDGATLTLPNQVLRWKLPDGDGEYYRWDGAFPKIVPANSTPESTGGIGAGAWVGIGDAALRSEINNVTRYFSTVAEMVSKGGNVGQRLVTLGYYSAGDGGGAEYIVKSGTAAQDYSDAGSVQIDSTKYAWLVSKDRYNFLQFGVKANDQAAADDNDVFIARAVLRGQTGAAELNISTVIYHRKPIVFSYYSKVIGTVIGADFEYTPRFIKIDNTTSGIPDLPYPGGGGSDLYDVDAGIIVMRPSPNAQHARGMTIKGFITQSLSQSIYAIYTPRMADFDIEVGSNGYVCGHYFHDIFLGRLGGKHILLGESTPDPVLSVGWFGTPTSGFGTQGAGNSVTFYGSVNSANRGVLLQGFSNAIFEHLTLEQIKIDTTKKSPPAGVYLIDSSASGVVSCESSTCCILRASNSISDISFSASYNISQNDSTEGIIRAISSSRIDLRSSTISASQPSLIIKDGTSVIRIGKTTKLSSVTINSTNNYNLSDERITSGSVTGSDSLSYPSGSIVGLSQVIGGGNVTISSGVIKFIGPCVHQIVIYAKGVSSGSLTYGINNTFNDGVQAGGMSTIMVSVSSGDTLNIKSASATTLSSTGGIVVFIYPAF